MEKIGWTLLGNWCCNRCVFTCFYQGRAQNKNTWLFTILQSTVAIIMTMRFAKEEPKRIYIYIYKRDLLLILKTQREMKK